MNISEFPRAQKQFFGLKILKFFNGNPDPGSGIFFTLNPGSAMKNSDPGSGINIPDPLHWILAGILQSASLAGQQLTGPGESESVR